MSQSIKRRIKELERVQAPNETHVIIISFVGPGNLDRVETELRLVGSDREWTRLPEEPEQEFIARARADLAPNQSHLLWKSWRQHSGVGVAPLNRTDENTLNHTSFAKIC